MTELSIRGGTVNWDVSPRAGTPVLSTGRVPEVPPGWYVHDGRQRAEWQPETVYEAKVRTTGRHNSIWPFTFEQLDGTSADLVLTAGKGDGDPVRRSGSDFLARARAYCADPPPPRIFG